MGIIKNDIIQLIKDNLKIENLIAENIKLKRSGNSFVGHCPFHDDNSPSLNVSPHKKLFYCFGCHTGGDIIRFYEKYHNVGFKEAVEQLAKKLGYKEEDIYISKKENEKALKTYKKKEKYFQIMEEACLFFENHLDQTSKDYLTKDRKLSWNTIVEYRIGSTPEGYSNLTLYLLNKQFDKELLLSSGLSIEINGELKDFFQNRIIIPISNPTGQVIAFSGRKKFDYQKAKYINSRESFIFHKKKTSFNLDKAKKEAFNKDYIIITEGYFDVLQLREYGIDNAIACMGTTIDEYQIQKISRLSPSQNVYLLFDNDDAGNQATSLIINKISRLIFSRDINLYIIRNKKTKDIDEYLKQGYSFEDLIKNSIFAIDYLIKKIILEFREDIPKSLHNLKSLCNKIKDEPLRIEYRKRIANYYSEGNTSLFKDYLYFLSDETNLENNKKQINNPKSNNKLTLNSKYIQLTYLALFSGYKLWICRELFSVNNTCPKKLVDILPPEIKNLFEIINQVQTNKYLYYNVKEFLDSYESNQKDSINKLLDFIIVNQNNLFYLEEDSESNIQEILSLLEYDQYYEYLDIIKQKMLDNSDDSLLEKYLEIKQKLLSLEEKIQNQIPFLK